MTKPCPHCGKAVKFIPALDWQNRCAGMGYYRAHDCVPQKIKEKSC